MKTYKLITDRPKTENEQSGDCVLRAFTLLSGMNYDQVREYIQQFEPDNNFAFRRPKNFLYLAEKLDLVSFVRWRFEDIGRFDIKTISGAIDFFEQYNIKGLVQTSNHIVYVDNQRRVYDSFHSVNKHTTSILIPRKDCDRLKIPYEKGNRSFGTFSEYHTYADPTTKIIKKGDRYIIMK